jgi:hypothetical protein
VADLWFFAERDASTFNEITTQRIFFHHLFDTVSKWFLIYNEEDKKKLKNDDC